MCYNNLMYTKNIDHVFGIFKNYLLTLPCIKIYDKIKSVCIVIVAHWFIVHLQNLIYQHQQFN